MKIDFNKTEKIIVPSIIVVSIIVPLLVLVLMYLPERKNTIGLHAGTLPLFHAILNGATAILLVYGFYLMKSGQILMHRNVMITAFFLSSVFLLSYVFSKVNTDPVPFGGEGFVRYIYFFILISHIILSAVIVPLVLFTMYRGLKGDYQKHRRVAKWTFPIWLYVTVSGVLVYVLMNPYY